MFSSTCSTARVANVVQLTTLGPVLDSLRQKGRFPNRLRLPHQPSFLPHRQDWKSSKYLTSSFTANSITPPHPHTPRSTYQDMTLSTTSRCSEMTPSTYFGKKIILCGLGSRPAICHICYEAKLSIASFGAPTLHPSMITLAAFQLLHVDSPRHASIADENLPTTQIPSAPQVRRKDTQNTCSRIAKPRRLRETQEACHEKQGKRHCQTTTCNL